MSADRLLSLVGQPGGPLADASLWPLEVTGAGPLTPHLRRLTFTAPGLGGLRYTPGQDLMLRVPLPGDRVVNRRYTIRAFDAALPSVTVDVSLHGAGPGTDWIRQAAVGDHIDAIGPRGKVTARADADAHLFIGDETGAPGALAMIEALPAGATATALLEVDGPADELPLRPDHAAQADIRWLHRPEGSVPGDPQLLLDAVTAVDLPGARGHVYVAAESRVVRSIQRALVDRGVGTEQVSAKAYWRRGLPNAEHGEPTRED